MSPSEQNDVTHAGNLWYNSLMTEFGNGPTLRESCTWLTDDHERHRRILDVTERNSVIEGLPPFREETRREILLQLQQISPAVPLVMQPE